MSKISEKLKEANFWINLIRSVIAIAVIVIPAVFALVKAIDTRFDNRLNAQLAPVNNYIYGQIEKLINKNFEKLAKDPADVKLIDLEYCISDWEFLKTSKQQNLKVLENKIAVIEKYYLEQSGKS